MAFIYCLLTLNTCSGSSAFGDQAKTTEGQDSNPVNNSAIRISANHEENLTSLEDYSLTEYPPLAMLEKSHAHATAEQIDATPRAHHVIQRLSLDEADTDCDDLTLHEKEELGEYMCTCSVENNIHSGFLFFRRKRRSSKLFSCDYLGWFLQ